MKDAILNDLLTELITPGFDELPEEYGNGLKLPPSLTPLPSPPAKDSCPKRSSFSRCIDDITDDWRFARGMEDVQPLFEGGVSALALLLRDPWPLRNKTPEFDFTMLFRFP